ncbi:hypothetical protein BT96DRAFT_1018444 [Gymnopus androsaceus JB14]|uniref:Uncharacterized protein n=1 Tax=Gymnopus androsaceus JB14 TaxID=1447944 RepID=A0A6A4HUH8_9AGAR|nr:hypothetical protein BT96DRAFT_1018444 [Gymnopus androsaceus JB14]
MSTEEQRKEQRAPVKTYPPQPYTIRGVKLSCSSSSSTASPENSVIPPSADVGDVHLDESTQTWWVFTPIDSTDSSKGNIWQSQSNQWAFQHPYSKSSLRYTWNKSERVWKIHGQNRDPVAADMEGVRKRAHPGRKKRNKGKQIAKETGSSDDEDDVVHSPPKRRKCIEPTPRQGQASGSSFEKDPKTEIHVSGSKLKTIKVSDSDSDDIPVVCTRLHYTLVDVPHFMQAKQTFSHRITCKVSQSESDVMKAQAAFEKARINLHKYKRAFQSSNHSNKTDAGRSRTCKKAYGGDKRRLCTNAMKVVLRASVDCFL